LSRLSFTKLAGIFKSRGHQSLTEEISKLHEYTISEFARIHAELGKLHGRAVPELERLGTELSALHDRAMSEFARFDNELAKPLGKAIDDIACLRDQVGHVDANGAQDIDFLREEQSRLHSLVSSRLVAQLEYLNRELYGLKQGLYHSGETPDEEAFNGQFSKHRIFADLCAVFSFQSFVETGAHTGSTTRFLCCQGKPVHAVEIAPHFFESANQRLRELPQAHLTLGDSADFLCTLCKKTLAPRELTFFYLDAHWRERLPLREELNTIALHHAHAVVMIDDFKIEDDPGYGYDAYDGGQEVSLAFLDDEIRDHGWQVFFPVLPSARDHMLTDILPPRGTAVMSSDPEILRTLHQVSSLRYWPISGIPAGRIDPAEKERNRTT
jgi:hypothetical protein